MSDPVKKWQKDYDRWLAANHPEAKTNFSGWDEQDFARWLRANYPPQDSAGKDAQWMIEMRLHFPGSQEDNVEYFIEGDYSSCIDDLASELATHAEEPLMKLTTPRSATSRRARISQPPANLAVFGDRKGSIPKDALQFERVFASRFVPRCIFAPRVCDDTDLLCPHMLATPPAARPQKSLLVQESADNRAVRQSRVGYGNHAGGG